jgi:hypothetical protein
MSQVRFNGTVRDVNSVLDTPSYLQIAHEAMAAITRHSTDNPVSASAIGVGFRLIARKST